MTPSSGSLAQTRNPIAQPRHGLMVPRVHLQGLPSSDASQQGAGLDDHAMSRQSFVLRSALDMVRGARQVLDQTASQSHIQHLHPAADREQRKVAVERFVDEGGFGGVALVIRGLCFGRRSFAVERGIDVAAAGEQEPRTLADLEAGPGFFEQRLRAGGFHRAGIRLRL